MDKNVPNLPFDYIYIYTHTLVKNMKDDIAESGCIWMLSEVTLTALEDLLLQMNNTVPCASDLVW